MALGKRLINTGGEAACLTETTDIFGDSSGVALYSLDYDASDASGTYDGSPTNVDFGVDGQINYGARFNGSSSSIVLPNNILSSDCSISTWFNLDSNTGLHTLFEFDYENRILFRTSSSDTNLAYIGDSGYFNHGLSFSTGQWYHLVITFSAGNPFKIYVDGVLSYTGGNTGVSAFNNDNILGAANSSGGGGLDGSIDQVRIFNRALLTDNNGVNEIATLYAETACVHTATTTDSDYPTTNSAYYKLDNSAEDSKGTNDGTEYNIEYRFGRYGQAAVFNGSSSKIDLGNNSSNNSSVISVSLWFKTAGHSGTAALINNGGANSGETGYYLGLNSNGTIKFEASTGTINGSVNYADSNWHHIVLTLNSGAYNIYVDGNTTPVITGSGAFTTTATRPTWIGQFSFTASNLEFFNGSIDEVRIFGSALSASNVTQLYNEKPETDTSNFKTVLYEGTGATQYISNVGFDLDVDNGGDGGLVWIKARETANSHALYDTVRGATNQLSSDLTAAEASYSTVLSSFDANGFFVETSSIVNTNNDGYVGWVWKGGGDAVNIGVNSITASTPSIASNVSANTEAGFSIVKFTVPASGDFSAGHGLSSPPEMVITKSTDTFNWFIFHKDLSSGANGKYALQFTTAAENGSFKWWGDGMTGDVIGGTANTSFDPGTETIAYCFHSVAEYSKIGTYEGLGTSTVTVSDVGFKPSFIMIKNIDATANWNMYDVRRSTVADRANKILYPNLSNSEPSATNYYFDMNDSGFVVSATNHEQHNFAGRTYIYMAFK